LLVPWRCSQWCAVASLFLSHTNTHARKFIRLELCFCQGATNPPTLSRLFALHAAPVKLHPPVPLVHTLHVSVRSDPWTYCYLYGLMIHKLGHFHDIVHGTRHDYYMNELRIEFLENWLDLLESKGFDPASVETQELTRRMVKQLTPGQTVN